METIRDLVSEVIPSKETAINVFSILYDLPGRFLEKARRHDMNVITVLFLYFFFYQFSSTLYQIFWGVMNVLFLILFVLSVNSTVKKYRQWAED